MVYCKKFARACDYCTETALIKVQRVGIISTGQLEKRTLKIKLGQWCENNGRSFVKDLASCPRDEALGCKMPEGPQEIDPLLWMKLHEGRDES